MRESDIKDNEKTVIHVGFPGGSDGKASACNAGDPGSIPGSGRSPGEGNGNPLQYSCLKPYSFYTSLDKGKLWNNFMAFLNTKSLNTLNQFLLKLLQCILKIKGNIVLK